MKFLFTLSAALALTTGMAAAVPMKTAPEVHMKAMMSPPNITDVESIARFVRINEKELNGPDPLGINHIGQIIGSLLPGSLRNAVAELLKEGDFAPKGPLDLAEQLLKLDIPGALRSSLQAIAGTLKSLPKGAPNIISGGK